MRKPKSRKIDKWLSELYRQINNPCGSTSARHRALHKMYASYRARKKYESKLGRLVAMHCETFLNTNAPNGSYIKRTKDGFIFKAKANDRMCALWQADAVEQWRKKNNGSSTSSVTIEVLPRYAVNVFLENNKKGRKTANKLRGYLFDNKLIDPQSFSGLTEQINREHFGKDLSVSYKRLHFELHPGLNPRKVDYGEFSNRIGKCEVERKHFFWNNSTDHLIFVVFDHDANKFKKDLVDLMESKGESIGVPCIYSVPYSFLDEVVSKNGGYSGVYKTEKPFTDLGKDKIFKKHVVEGFN